MTIDEVLAGCSKTILPCAGRRKAISSNGPEAVWARYPGERWCTMEDGRPPRGLQHPAVVGDGA